jgi:hypothetical protein
MNLTISSKHANTSSLSDGNGNLANDFTRAFPHLFATSFFLFFFAAKNDAPSISMVHQIFLRRSKAQLKMRHNPPTTKAFLLLATSPIPSPAMALALIPSRLSLLFDPTPNKQPKPLHTSQFQ